MSVCDLCGEVVPEGAEVFTAPDTPDDLEDPDRSGVYHRECAETVLGVAEVLGEGGSIHPLGEPDLADAIAADAPPGDTYNREQAARILGVSARRVSQLAAEDRLEVVQAKPLRLSAESVHRMREERRSPGRDQRATVPPDPAGDVAAQIERVVGLVVAEHRKAIEAGEHLLAEVSAQRDEYRAEVERLRESVEAERAARELAEQRAREAAETPPPRRSWWRRG